MLQVHVDYVVGTLLFFQQIVRCRCIQSVAHIVPAAMPASTVAVPPHSAVPLSLEAGRLLVNTLRQRSFSNSPRIITQSTPRHAMMLVIESGVLYLLVQLINLVLFVLNSLIRSPLLAL